MRTLPLLLVVAAALLAPSQALAGGGASTPSARYFVITGLVLGDQKIEASGKLGIQGDQLMASVGCNSIGGTVSVDGDRVTITDPLVQTEMACPGVAMDTEAAFVKILQDHGPFRIGDGAWVGDGAQIQVQELDVPDPGRTLPPDQPVCSTDSCGVPEPMPSCPVLIDPGFGGGATGSGGSSGSGGGSVGSGTTTEGSTGTGSSGENPTETAIAEPVEVPPATPAVEPGGTADPNATVEPEGTVEPDGSGDPGAVPPAPPAPDQTPGLDQGPEPSFVIVEPAPSAIPAPDPGTGTDPGIGVDPGAGKPPVDDPCVRYYANDLTSGAGAGAEPPQADAAAAEHAKTASSASPLAVPVAVALIVLLGVTAGGFRRWRATRPGTEADASR